MTDAMDNLEELLRLSGGDGQIFTMEGPLCMKSVQSMFGYDCNSENKLYTSVCYVLCTNITLSIYIFYFQTYLCHCLLFSTGG